MPNKPKRVEINPPKKANYRRASSSYSPKCKWTKCLVTHNYPNSENVLIAMHDDIANVWHTRVVKEKSLEYTD